MGPVGDFLDSYTPVIEHSSGKSPFSIGNTSSKGPFSIAMLDYRSVKFIAMMLEGHQFSGYRTARLPGVSRSCSCGWLHRQSLRGGTMLRGKVR